MSEATFVSLKQMFKKEFRVLIKECFSAKKNTVGAKIDIIWTLQQEYQPFKLSKMSTEDDVCSGRPKVAVTNANMKKVHKIILENRKVNLIEIGEILNISKERVGHILNEFFSMSKIYSKLVIDNSEQYLELFYRNKPEFLRQYVRMNE